MNTNSIPSTMFSTVKKTGTTDGFTYSGGGIDIQDKINLELEVLKSKKMTWSAHMICKPSPVGYMAGVLPWAAQVKK